MRLLFVNEVQVLLLFKFVFHPAENLRTKKKYQALIVKPKKHMRDS